LKRNTDLCPEFVTSYDVRPQNKVDLFYSFRAHTGRLLTQSVDRV